MSYAQFNPPQGYPGGGQGQTRAKDDSDLNLLGTLHYVWSGLMGFATLAVIAYFVLLGGVFGMSAASGSSGAGGAAAVAGIMLVMGVVMGVVMIALVVVHVMAASGLKNRNRRTLTFVASVLMCTSFPLGTALGVWTIMVLGRPGVKALYGVS
jgi:hypothetical protein